jgi:ribosomal protein S18 acetylase RimI-like enzyme
MIKTCLKKRDMNQKEIYKEDSSDDIIIRRAVKEDIESLVDLSRISFPNLLAWCTRSQARKTWEHIINSEYQDVWVCQFNNEVVAVIRLETDLNKNKEIMKDAKPDLYTVLVFLILHPWVLIEKIVKRIIRKYSRDKLYCDDLKEFGKNSVWCFTSAVHPKMRNRGIGSRMMCFCEVRALELGYDSMKFCIKKRNKGSIRLHERLGFIRVGEIKDEYFYIKKLAKTGEKKFTFTKIESSV